MFSTTHTIKQAAASLALATTIAVLVVPTALAGGNSSGTYQDGWYGYAVSLTKQQHQTTPLDGRSPDTRDAAAGSSAQPLASIDGRSPDTVDAAITAHSPVVTVVRSPGFQWDDFGIGIAAAFGLMLLAAISLRVLTTRNRQPGPVATA
jgi:hypothetical protein